MSKSSANPRKYSKGRDGLDPATSCVVFVELRCGLEAIERMDAQLRFLQSRHEHAVVDVAGIRKEGPSRFVVTLAIDMGPIRQALRGTTLQCSHGYRLLWEIWVQMPECTPVFTGAPAQQDAAAARAWHERAGQRVATSAR